MLVHFSEIRFEWQLIRKTHLFHHDDVIEKKHFPRYWPFVRGTHRSPHKGQWRGALMFSLIYARINDWVNNREAGVLRRQRGHYDVIVMIVFNYLVHKYFNISQHIILWLYLVFCLPYFHVSNKALLLSSTTALSFFNRRSLKMIFVTIGKLSAFDYYIEDFILQWSGYKSSEMSIFIWSLKWHYKNC